jgi:hypothetical protein
MIRRLIKTGLMVVLVVLVVGSFVFGRDVLSYARSSAKWTQSVVKDSVPVEFELRRAWDLLEEILPEIHANIRLIAQEEVEVAALKGEIGDGAEGIEQEQSRIGRLREALGRSGESIWVGSREYSHKQLAEELAWRFDRFKEAELVLASKKRLLATREESLRSSMQLLERTKAQKRLLASKIEGLESKYRLIKASAVGSGIQVDSSKLARTEKLIGEIKKRLDVAERVLAHESHFVASLPADEVSEKDLTAEIDEYFSSDREAGADVQ